MFIDRPVGIDLGTTNSLIATVQSAVTRALPEAGPLGFCEGSAL